MIQMFALRTSTTLMRRVSASELSRPEELLSTRASKTTIALNQVAKNGFLFSNAYAPTVPRSRHMSFSKARMSMQNGFPIISLTVGLFPHQRMVGQVMRQHASGSDRISSEKPVTKLMVFLVFLSVMDMEVI